MCAACGGITRGGHVTSIRAEGFANLVTKEERDANFSSVREMRGQSAYMPNEEIPEPFGVPDLFFNGLDFTIATRSDCLRLFGEPFEYADRNGMRIMSYPGLAVEINPEFDGRMDAFAVMSDAVEGPRGVRVGDARQNVINLFGGDEADVLTYSCLCADGQYYTFQCTFFSGVMTEYQVTRR